MDSLTPAQRVWELSCFHAEKASGPSRGMYPLAKPPSHDKEVVWLQRVVSSYFGSDVSLALPPPSCDRIMDHPASPFLWCSQLLKGLVVQTSLHHRNSYSFLRPDQSGRKALSISRHSSALNHSHVPCLHMPPGLRSSLWINYAKWSSAEAQRLQHRKSWYN